MNSNSDSSNPTFQLDYLNVSSNRLTTLDVDSIKCLNQTTIITNLTANPWNCDYSVLIEVWRGLKHKLTLYCASPRELQGKLWDEIGEFCSHVVEDMNKKLNKSSQAVSLSTEYKDESAVITQSGGLSVVTITLIVVGVPLVCAVGGGVIWVRVVKGRRDRPKTPENCDVDASIHSMQQ
jgi:hypothetical protein